MTAPPPPSLRPLGAIFFDRVEELGDHPFVNVPGGHARSWRDAGVAVSETVRGLHDLGLVKGDRVSLLAENRIAGLFVDVGAIAAGMVLVSNRPGYSDALVARILDHARVRAVFVDDAIGVARILRMREALPWLRFVIAFDGLPPGGAPGCLGVDELRARGRHHDEVDLRAALDAVRLDDMASIEYTSGSTGEPKGVVKTNRNLVQNHLAPMLPEAPLLPARSHEVVPITLTLNHLLGRGLLHRSVIQGRTLAMLELTEPELHLPQIRAMKPVVMTVVPRVMLRLWDEFLLANPAWRDRADRLEGRASSARAAGAPPSDALLADTPLSPGETAPLEPERSDLRAHLVAAFGGALDRIYCTGAPLPSKILRTFDVVGFPLLGYYGSTECGVITTPDSPHGGPRARLGNVGWPYPGTSVTIASDGEVLVRGPAVMPEYLENPSATTDVFDADGWFHTGDLGSFDSDGCLRLVGRKKDIFNTADGSNVYPTHIEATLEGDALIHQAVVVGDRRPYLVALVVPDAAKVAVHLGVADPTEEHLASPAVHALLWSRVEAINARAEANERIRAIAVLNTALPANVRVAAGALGKSRTERARADETYRAEIDLLYAPSSSTSGR